MGVCLATGCGSMLISPIGILVMIVLSFYYLIKFIIRKIKEIYSKNVYIKK